MEILTNYDALIYIYLGITLGSLIYPVQLMFRVNFVNFLFMLLLYSAITIFKFDIYMEVKNLFETDIVNFFLMIYAVVIVIIIYFRFTKNLTMIDSLFLGILPYSVVFFLVVANFKPEGMSIELSALAFIYFLVPYAILTYKKMIFTLPFSVKGMADNY